MSDPPSTLDSSPGLPLSPARRSFLTATLAAVTTLFLAAVTPACGPDSPRALIIADGSGTAHTVGVAARAKFYQERSGRQVRVMVVDAQQAVTLASRGEADVAVVPQGISLDTFIASEHGRLAGLFVDGGERLRILEVNAKQHPKVDEQGAHALASALITPP